jgi:hypothetical protein
MGLHLPQTLSRTFNSAISAESQSLTAQEGTEPEAGGQHEWRPISDHPTPTNNSAPSSASTRGGHRTGLNSISDRNSRFAAPNKPLGLADEAAISYGTIYTRQTRDE